MSKWCPKIMFFLKIWPNPGCGFCAIFKIVGPPVKGLQTGIKDFRGAIKGLQKGIKDFRGAIKGLQKGIKDFRGAIKSHQRAITGAQKAIEIPQKRSGAPRDLFSFIGAVRRAFIHLRLV